MADHTIIVTNGASTPSGGKRWRWERRDHHGHLLAAGPWQTNPVRAMPVRADLERIAAVDVGDSSFGVPVDQFDDPTRPDLHRARADAAG